MLDNCLGYKIITVKQWHVDLCETLFQSRKLYIMAPPSSEQYNAFVTECKKYSVDNKLSGVYTLINKNSGESYVGQSINILNRIRAHLTYRSITTSSFVKSAFNSNDFSGTIELCVITPEVLFKIAGHNNSLSFFLDVLEQYIMLKTMPSVNKLLVVRHGGNLRTFASVAKRNKAILTRYKLHPHSQLLYIYKLQKSRNLQGVTLIFTTSTLSKLGILLEMPSRGAWAHTVIQNGGFIRDTVYITITPLPNSDILLLSQEEFVHFIKSLLKSFRNRTRNNIYLINMNTNKRIGPFPSAMYICEHVIPGGNRRAINPSRIKPYRGYFIEFED